MTFNYNDLSYEKRPLTDDVALWVVTKEFPDTEEKLSEFEKLAKPFKTGEYASQQDACPVVGINGLRDYVDHLKGKYEGFRIRHAQLSAAAAVNGAVSNVSDETAAHLIAAGSIAVIAERYENGADKVLLANGILPLLSDEALPTGTFVLVRNARKGVSEGRTESYTVTPENDEPVNIGIGKYSDKELEKVIN